MATPSLLLIPDRYKASKLYSQIPDSGAGDLAFTRANDTATRVNSSGLIEKVRTNLILQSNSFDTTWVNDDSTETSGQAGYDGTNNAWLLTKTGANGRIGQVISFGGSATFSVFVKAGTDNFVKLASSDAGVQAYFDLTNGTIGTTGAGTLAKITSAGNGFFRCSISGNASFTFFNIWVADADNDTTGASGNIFIQNAQLEAGDIATPYIPTTTAAVSVGPVANIPRIDYTGGGCGKLLLEPQRTNLQLNSEDFSQANWSKTNTTIVVNQLASPDSYVNADKLNETAVNNIHQLESTRTVVAATQYTMSVFAKKAERSIVRVYEDTTNNGSYFDLNNGTLLTLTGPTASAKIENYGNGWYRCSVTYTETNTSGRYRILVTNADNVTSYLGVAGNGIYIYGAQYEAGAYPTSYIPTLGASVTRSADAASKTGISSLIGQQEGVIFVDFVYNAVTPGTSASNIINSERNTNASFFINRIPSTQFCNAGLFIGGTTVAAFNAGLIPLGQRTKIAYAYKSGSSALYINGVQLGLSSVTFTIPDSLDDIHLNDVVTYFSFQENVSFNTAALYPIRLTNSELASLTTL